MRYVSALQAGLFLCFVIAMSVFAALNMRTFDLPAGTRLVDGNRAKVFEAQFDAKFPAKKLGVNLWAAVDYVLFREGKPGVVLGRRGWLYTDEEFVVAEGYERHIRDNLKLIESIHQELTKQGVALVVAIVPAKARVYSEFLTSRTPAEPQLRLHARLLEALTRGRIPTADLFAPLQQGKILQPTYLRADTHWTPWGAKLAAARTAQVVRESAPATTSASRFITHREATRTHRGDLVNFLPLDPYFAALLPQPESVDVMKTAALAEGAHLQSTSTNNADLFGDATVPTLALVGTSYSANALWNFAGYLRESLGEDIANYSRQGKGPFVPMLSYLRSEDFRRQRPRLIIWEIPERSLVSPAS